MDWIHELGNVNYVAVAVATFSSYVLGFIWYHWTIFGESWATSLGLTKEQADNTDGLGGAFAMSLVGGVVKTLFMALLMKLANIDGVFVGAIFGAITALALISTSLAYYNNFARVPSKLTTINCAHCVVELTLIGAIIGGFA